LSLGHPSPSERDVRSLGVPERPMSAGRSARIIDPRSTDRLGSRVTTMRTLFTGCVQCGILTTNIDGYCRDCADARAAKRRDATKSQQRVHAPKSGRSTAPRR
jgi:hypothetical protein